VDESKRRCIMKIKEQVLKQKDNDFQESLSILEWLDYFSKKPSSKEVDVMEKYLSNNPNYQPLKEA